MKLSFNRREGSVKNYGLLKEFLLSKETKQDLLVFSVLNIAIYIFMAYAYPYMVAHPDSETYIVSAYYNEISGYRPFGYSWFIGFMHSISPSLRALFVGQFVLNFISQVVLLLTVKYLFNLKRLTYYVLAGTMFLSPCILFCTNYIMSDSVFHSLTLLYLATLLIILYKPNWLTWVVHFAVLFAAINVRYTALFYPILSAIVIFYHYRKRGFYKLIALAPFFVIAIIYNNTKSAFVDEFGVSTFSPFSGWALVNNATSIIPHATIKPTDFKDKNLRLIHGFFNSFPDTTYSSKNVNATAIMWDNELPAKQYLYYYLQQYPQPYVKAWVRVGEQFKQYGKTIIKQHPIAYIKHFIVPNFLNFFNGYSLPEQTTYTPSKYEKDYYHLKIEKQEYNLAFFNNISSIRKVFDLILRLVFLGAIVMLIVKRKTIGFTPLQFQLMGVLLLFTIMYIGFSTVTHPVNNFRYILPLEFVQLFFPILVLSKLVNGRVVK